MSRLLAAILVLFSLAAGTAQAQSLTATPSSLYASDTTTAAWSGIASPTSTDWVGLYAVGAPDSATLVWTYTNGSASGSAPIAIPNTTAAGSYELRIFENNSYTKLATSNGITVQPPPPANLSASPSSLNASQTVTAAWSSIYSPTSTDWVGLYAVGAADSAVIAWTYANGSASGSAPIVVPNTTAPGAYELRLFSNNSYAKLATSNGITVQPQPAASLTAAPASLYASQSVTANWSSILAPTATDWIGLYAVGAADIGGAINWQFTNGSASGSVPIVVPNTTAPGAYELRLFSNNTYTRLATSNGITVQPPPPANLTAAPANLYASQSVTANWSSILAPTATDWIGMYAVGAADSAVIAWQYASGSASGSVPIQVPNTTVAGAYELRLFANNSYTKLATSNGFSVDPPPPATLTVTGSAAPGGSVTANWASILAPTATDWLGLYLPGAADNAVLAWQYTTGVAAGNVPFSLPASLAQGSYELRLFANNGYTRLATSASFGVGVMKLSFIHPDHLNTPRLVADATGTTVWRWDQAEPFGVNVPDENPGGLGTFDLPLRLPEQYFDKETNLAYNYYRDYDPGIGRYAQSDPIGLGGGINTYSYVGGSPVRFFDPYGLFRVIRVGPSPQTFAEANALSKREALLRRLGNAMQDRISTLCSADRERLQKIFDNWEVYVDPNIDNVFKRDRGAYARTRFSTQKTQFNLSFYNMTILEPGEYFTFAHEFRHLMRENNALYSTSSIGKQLLGNDGELAGEKDADSWAGQFISNSCKCGLQ